MAIGATGLARILPNGTAVYVALGFAVDELAGTIDELTDPGYGRKSHSAWATVVGLSDMRRQNNGAVVFDALVEGAKDIAWWALFDAPVGGNMIAAGQLLNGSGEPEPQTVNGGDQPRFNDGDIRIIATPEAA